MECDYIRLHYVSRTEQRWTRLQYQQWLSGWEPEKGVIDSTTTHLWPHTFQAGGLSWHCVNRQIAEVLSGIFKQVKANPYWKQKRKSLIWKGKDKRKAYGRDWKSSTTSRTSESNDKWAGPGSRWVLRQGRRSWCRCADHCRWRKCIEEGNYREEEVGGWVADCSKKTERRKKKGLN